MTSDGVRIEKLGINNWPVWKRQMSFLLKSKKLFSAINPDATDSGTRAGSKGKTEDSDEAQGIIGLHVENYLLRDIEEAESARAVQGRFAEEGNKVCILMLFVFGTSVLC